MKVTLGLKGGPSSGSGSRPSDRISAMTLRASSSRFFCSVSDWGERLRPIVPRRTRMVTNPQRMVILMLLRVLAIWRPRGVRRVAAVAMVVGRVAPPVAVAMVVERFWAVKLSRPMVGIFLGGGGGLEERERRVQQTNSEVGGGGLK